MLRRKSTLKQRECGASLVEYCLLAAAIAAVCIAVAFAVGGSTKNLYQDTDDAMSEEF